MKLHQLMEIDGAKEKYDELIKWCDDNLDFPGSYDIRLKNGTIIFNKDLILFKFKSTTEFPAIITSVNHGSIYCTGPLASFKNAPESFQRYFWTNCVFHNLNDYPKNLDQYSEHYFKKCNNLTDISGMSNIRIDSLRLDSCQNVTSSVISQLPLKIRCLIIEGCPKLTSLSGIHRDGRHLRTINIGSYIQHGLLGLILMDTEFGAHSAVDDENGKFNDLQQALDIIKKYQGKGKQGIIEAQQELIDNDLDDYAEM